MSPRFRLLIALLLTALVGSACGSGAVTEAGASSSLDSDYFPAVEIQPSRDFVLASAARTEASSYRFEMSIRMDVDMGFVAMRLPGNKPSITGSASGDQIAMVMDMGVMFEELADSDPMFEEQLKMLSDFTDDLTMEMVIDGTRMYLHAPLFGVPNAGFSAMGLDSIANGWGLIDLSRATGFSSSDLAGITGMTGGDPTSMLAILESAGATITDSGREKLRGIDTTRLLVPVTFGELMESQGQFADFGTQFTADPLTAGMFDDLLSTYLLLVVNVDDSGLLRRISFDMPMTEMLEGIAQQTGQTMPFDVTMEVGMTLDLFDYGTDVTVEIPNNAVDVTDVFLALMP
jgi:hypothetical protein